MFYKVSASRLRVGLRNQKKKAAKTVYKKLCDYQPEHHFEYWCVSLNFICLFTFGGGNQT